MLTRVRLWVTTLLGRDRFEDEVSEELAFHLRERTEHWERQGIAPAEAQRRARLEFGNPERVKEDIRDVRLGTWLQELGQDLRYGVRMLLKGRSFTAVAMLSLALGVGLNTAVFSVVDSMLFRPLPYEEPEQLVMIERTHPNQLGQGRPPQVAEYLTWRQQVGVFEEMAAVGNRRRLDIASDGHPTEFLTVGVVSANLFDLAGVEPILGRGFLPTDEAPGAEDVVVLSHAVWQRRFQEDPEAIGRLVWLDRTPATIVGVMPAGFDFVNHKTPLWIPARFTPDSQRPAWIAARLLPDTPIEVAQAAVDVLAERAEAFPTEEGWGLRVVPLHLTWHYSGEIRGTALVLWGAVGFVLVISCANVAGVLLARASSRTREVATRLAVGASRWRIVRLFLAEGLLLAVAGGTSGALLAYWGIRVIQAVNPDQSVLVNQTVFPRLGDATVDGRVLTYTLLVSLLTALLFSVAPAIKGSKPNLTESLKDLGRGADSGRGRLRLQGALIVVQIALALVLLAGAALMVSTMLNLRAVDPGFDAERILTLRLPISRDNYWLDPARKTQLSSQVDAFFERVLRRLETLPGVEAAAGIDILPLSRTTTHRGIAIDGRPPPNTPNRPFHERPRYSAVMGEFFGVMGIPLLQGRAFTSRDVAEAPWVVVINQAMAERYWPGEDPVGKYLTVARGTFGEAAPGERPREVVGVVGNVRHWSLQFDPDPHMYVPQVQQSLEVPPGPPGGDTTRIAWGGRVMVISYVLRTLADPMSVAPLVQGAVAEINPDQPVALVTPMEQLFSIWTDGPRFYTMLMVSFAAVALALSLVGIYGVMAYSVTQRTHEIGIRMALGAGWLHVVTLVTRRGVVLGAMGLGVGLVGAFWLTRLMGVLRVDIYEGNSTSLYGVTARDPSVLVIVSALVCGAVLLACYGPARRATKVDPMAALRHE